MLQNPSIFERDRRNMSETWVKSWTFEQTFYNILG